MDTSTVQSEDWDWVDREAREICFKCHAIADKDTRHQHNGRCKFCGETKTILETRSGPNGEWEQV